MVEELLSQLLLAVGTIAVGLALAQASSGQSNGLRISQEDTKRMTGKDHVHLLDVRQPGAWEESGRKIKGAVRENPRDVDTWAGKYSQSDTLILYCS